MKPDIQALLDRHKKKFADTIVYCAEIEKIIDEIVVETGINKMNIKKMVDAQFKMLRHTMSNEGVITAESNFSDLKSIRLFAIGSFRPSEHKFKYIQEFLRKKNIEEND